MRQSNGLLVLLLVAAGDIATSFSVCEDVYPHLPMSLNIRNQFSCKAAGGCWSETDQHPCYFPKVFGYEYSEISSGGGRTVGNLTLIRPSGALGNDFKDLSIDITQETKSRTHIKIAPQSADRWEIPEFLIPRPTEVYDGEDATTNVFIPSSSPFELGIRSKNQILFYMSKMLIFQDQYIEVVLSGSNFKNTFGFGESSRLQQSLEEGKSYTLWNSDIPAANFNTSLYGSHPFMLHLLEDGTACGVLFMNSNAMSVTYNNPKSTGGSDPASFGLQSSGGLIDFYIFAGPTPLDVVKQLQEVIGLPALQPYWSLGFHNCRWGYTSIQEVADVVANYSAANIPLETQWVDIDYMQDYLDFTTDAELFPADKMKAFVEELHANDQYFVPIIDPGIFSGKTETPYNARDSGLEKKVFVRDLTGENYFVGVVWPGTVYFPDWFAANTTDFWIEQLSDFHAAVPFDGIWIDMNEVSNFADPLAKSQVCVMDETKAKNFACSMVDPDNKYDNAPWSPPGPGPLGGRTLPMSSVHTVTDSVSGEQTLLPEYNTHNLHGLMESIATKKAVEKTTNSRPFVLSRSTTLSSGKYTAHWTGDNSANWDDMKVSIITMKTLALFGIPMTGADICGFMDDSNEELCGRWAQVGAFSPFMRNHNTQGTAPQEFYRWDSVAAISRSMIAMRYSLLPHLYTLLHAAHTEGSTVMNGLWMTFPADPEACSAQADGQYMWGDSILFSPVLEQGSDVVSAYFPAGVWYSLFDSSVVDSRESGGQWEELSTPFSATNAHARGGSVIARHHSGTISPASDKTAFMTTKEARKAPYSLLVSLDHDGKAQGSLFLDDGVQQSLDIFTKLEFTARSVGLKGQLRQLSIRVADTGGNGGYYGTDVKGNALQMVEVNDVTLSEMASTSFSCAAVVLLGGIDDAAINVVDGMEAYLNTMTQGESTQATTMTMPSSSSVRILDIDFDSAQEGAATTKVFLSMPVNTHISLASDFDIFWQCK